MGRKCMICMLSYFQSCFYYFLISSTFRSQGKHNFSVHFPSHHGKNFSENFQNFNF